MYDRVVAGTIFKVFGMTQESIKDRTFFLFAIYRLSKKSRGYNKPNFDLGKSKKLQLF